MRKECHSEIQTKGLSLMLLVLLRHEALGRRARDKQHCVRSQLYNVIATLHVYVNVHLVPITVVNYMYT